MHVTTDDNAPITYDAYIKLTDIEEYFTIENKLVYIKILSRDYRGFMGTELNKKDNEIIIKNSLYKGMLHMVRLFNHKCRQHPFLKMHQKTYFLIEGRDETNEFTSVFYKEIRPETLKNNPETITVFITVKDLDKCKQLKDVWSIEIDQVLYRFAQAHITEKDIALRKKYSGEFVGFDDQTTPAAVQEAYTAQNP
ncbi:hypothetical protein RclHR1_04160003 [Rhizophagus clarus]|uniref:Uncharacterized protein n=1 Tax=Rhizophagus clarus TaxID=94130 RepID=A0A2Z6RFB5_9GLOM|nr:hypothetical protein RclHR1_04160003 [Rhizophagus clarus]